MKKILLISLTSIIPSIFFTPGTFGYSGEVLVEKTEIKSVQTLKEIQSNINSLEKEKIRLEFKWETFLIGSEKLGNLIKSNLTLDEKRALESHIISYSHSKSALEQDLSSLVNSPTLLQERQKDLLVLKQEFYMLLVSYIEISKLPDFKKYVAGELIFHEKSKDVGIEITQKNIEKQERVLELEDKALKNSLVLRNQIESKMTQQVQEKLDIFINDEKFKSLSIDKKIYIFQTLKDKITLKLSEFEETPNATKIINDKAFIYNLVIDILDSYIAQWQ